MVHVPRFYPGSYYGCCGSLEHFGIFYMLHCLALSFLFLFLDCSANAVCRQVASILRSDDTCHKRQRALVASAMAKEKKTKGHGGCFYSYEIGIQLHQSKGKGSKFPPFQTLS